jgi:ferredoxin-like protein FixX
VVDYTRCVECGACQYSCINQNIHLEYPRGGFGVVFLY